MQLKVSTVSLLLLASPVLLTPRTAYSFLDPSKEHGLVAAYVLGIAVAEAVVFTPY